MDKRNMSKARKRAELIMKVRSGRMTAKAAAEELGVARKTYYEWEKRGLEGMMDALENRQTGRPAKLTDPEKEKLHKEINKLESKLLMHDMDHELNTVLQSLPRLRDLIDEEDLERIEKKVRKKR